MTDRCELLARKGQEILDELSSWAQEELQLELDESLTVTLVVERMPLVVRVPTQEGGSVIDMPLLDFFSRQRCMDIVGDISLATRVHRRLTHEGREAVHPNLRTMVPDLRTVGDLVAFGKYRLSQVESIGKGVIGQIERVLAAEGLKLDL